MKCCDKPMIDARGYPAGTYSDLLGNIVTRMVTVWRCLNCGAWGEEHVQSAIDPKEATRDDA